MTTTKSRILPTILRHLRLRPTFDSVGIDKYRQLIEKNAKAFKPHKRIKSEPFHIKNIEAKWLVPLHHNEKRIILYIHGGGYIAGSIKTHMDIASRIATASEAKVLLFNYRLAPENPFPAGLFDIKTVYHWLMDKYQDTCKISLVADSAGAGLGLALLSELLKKDYTLPECSVLISPWIDLECKNRSIIENQEKDPMLTHHTLRKTAQLYTDQDLSNPLISPINNDFTGISPMLIQVGEHEVLIDDSKILEQKLKSAGATVQLEIWDEMFHVWQYFARYLPEGKKAINHIGDFIKKYS